MNLKAEKKIARELQKSIKNKPNRQLERWYSTRLSLLDAPSNKLLLKEKGEKVQNALKSSFFPMAFWIISIGDAKIVWGTPALGSHFSPVRSYISLQ